MILEEKIQTILLKYKDEISVILNGDLENLENVEKGISISRNYIRKLRLALREEKFKDEESEVFFFKYQKPCVHSKIKFFSNLYQFLLRKPQGSIKKQRQFLDEQIENSQIHCTEILDFVKYNREEATYLDKYYFLRGRDEVKLVTDNSNYLLDEEFSTSHDNLVASILSKDLLINYFKQLLEELRMCEDYKSIYPKDIHCLTGRNERHGRKPLNDIRTHFEKQSNQFNSSQ